MKRLQSQHGFFLIEVVVASAVIATALVLLLGSIQNSVEVSQRSLERTAASFLLEEGVEAMKSIRDTNWATVSTLTPNTTYYLQWSGSAWTISQTVTLIDRYTRTISVESVYRDAASDDIDEGGALDTDAKKVTVKVTWNAPSGLQEDDLSFYIFNIR
jgi:Tfp pilus assembly protein PilV